jgi:hypothetical protein
VLVLYFFLSSYLSLPFYHSTCSCVVYIYFWQYFHSTFKIFILICVCFFVCLLLVFHFYTLFHLLWVIYFLNFFLRIFCWLPFYCHFLICILFYFFLNLFYPYFLLIHRVILFRVGLPWLLQYLSSFLIHWLLCSFLPFFHSVISSLIFCHNYIIFCHWIMSVFFYPFFVYSLALFLLYLCQLFAHYKFKLILKLER